MQTDKSQRVERLAQRFRLFGRNVAIGAVLIVLCDSSWSPAQTNKSQPAGRELKLEVARLLKDLGSDSRKTRNAAETRLLKLGPPVLPLLPPPELTPEISVREAVRRVRLRLEHRKAQQSVKASRVTLKRSVSLDELCREVTRQTGNEIETAQLPMDLRKKKHTVTYRDASFWSVIADASKRWGVAFRFRSDRDGLTARKRTAASNDQRLAADDSGAFRLVVLAAEWKPLFGNKDHRLLRVEWSISAEPRLRPLFLAFGGKDVSAAIGGKSLSPFDPDGKYEIPANEPVLKLRSDFLVPKATEVRFLGLAGKLRMLTAAAEEPLSFRNLAKATGAAKRRGGVTVTVRKVTLPGKNADDSQLSVAVAVAYDAGGPAFESHRTWVYANRVFLESAKGKRIEPLPGYKTVLQRDGAVGIEHKFRVTGEDVSKLQYVYLAPTLLIDVPLNFDFKKIPIPAPPVERTSQ